jgi:hypothetical protein
LPDGRAKSQARAMLRPSACTGGVSGFSFPADCVDGLGDGSFKTDLIPLCPDART